MEALHMDLYGSGTMESWRKAWRDGFAPQLTTAGLQSLADALAADSGILCQGRAVERLANSKNRVARCCAISYALAADDVLLASARAMETAFAEADLQANGLLGGHFAYCFYAWFDDGPRAQVFAELLAEVRHNIADRQQARFDMAADDMLTVTANEHVLAGAA
jgi:hypothetical protein